MTLLYEILKIKDSSFSSIFKTFQKPNAQLISNRKLIFYDPPHLYLFSASFSMKLQIVAGS